MGQLLKWEGIILEEKDESYYLVYDKGHFVEDIYAQKITSDYCVPRRKSSWGCD